MIETYILKIDRDLSKDEFMRLLSFVSDEKKEKILRFHRFEDAQRSLLGDLLARYAICKRLSINNKDLVFAANEYRKPVLIAPNIIHFNISHSGIWVVCVVDDNPVGIDVEEIKPINLGIAERFFSRDEYFDLMNQPEEMKLKYFYMLWTLKESYVKAEGKGLYIPLDSFTIKLGFNDYSNTMIIENKKYHFSQEFLNNNTIISVCSINGNTLQKSFLDMNFPNEISFFLV